MPEEDEEEELEEDDEDSDVKQLKSYYSEILKRQWNGEIKGETILWRYINLMEFMDMILNKTLYFRSVVKFEDNYERTLPEEIKSKLFTELSGILHLGAKEIEKIIQNAVKNIRSNKERMYANCWSFSKDNYGLWNVYTRNKTYGIAIETTIDKLCKCFNGKFEPDGIKFSCEQPTEKIFGNKVYYNWKDIELLNIHKNQVEITEENISFYKTSNYEYEQEYRVIIYSNNQMEEALQRSVELDELITGWYPSSYMPVWFRDVLLSYVKMLNANLFSKFKVSEINV
jgi:hypothetical protein